MKLEIITEEFIEPLEFQLDWAIIFAQLHQFHEYFRSLMNPEKHDGKSWDIVVPVTAQQQGHSNKHSAFRRAGEKMKGGKEESILQGDQVKGMLRKHEKGIHNFLILWKCLCQVINTRGLTAASCQRLVPKAPLLLQLRAKSTQRTILLSWNCCLGSPHTVSSPAQLHMQAGHWEQEPQVCSVNTHLYPDHAWDVQPHWRWLGTTDHALLYFYTT